MHMYTCVRISRQVYTIVAICTPWFADLNLGPNGLGGECADNFETGSRSAAAGGTTTIITFATQTRDDADRSLIKVVEAYNARAEATGSYIDYGFHIIIVRNDPEILENELPVLVRDWGVTSCKLFMTYESQRLTDTQLLDVMLASQKNEITTVSTSQCSRRRWPSTDKRSDDTRRER
jgi:dihydropyrimidinase